MSEVEDFFQENSQQARVGMVASLDEDPEAAARSIELSDASGVPATAIYGDVDGFERQHKAALGSHIIANNSHIANYLNSHPLAARLSHDDLGQLDEASRSISTIPDRSSLQRATSAFREGFGEFSDKAIFSDPYLRRPSDVDFVLRHPEVGSALLGVAGLVGAPLVVTSKVLSGALSVVNEFGGREAAGMLEYGLMRGDIRSPGTGGTADLALIGQALRSATPWLRSGRDAPAAIDPMIDKVKTQQAKVDGDTLADALKESLKSTTRERSPEFYSNFVRSHVGDREIGIAADAIRELYGDKLPEPSDNILGWVPDLHDKLSAAEASGGDVKVPLADWLAKVDPEVAKELHDHLRVRSGGLTIEEGKSLKPKEAIAEPLASTRGSSALEPLFSVGDRKVKLERLGKDPDTEFRKESSGFHDFNLLDETGKTIGSLNLSEQKGGKQLYIEMIQAGADRRMYDPNFLGPALIRDIGRQLKAEFPNAFGPDGLGITGHRVSGAREKAGTWEKPSAMPMVKFDEGITPSEYEAVRQILNDAWSPVGQGVEANIKGRDLYTANEQKLIDATNEVLGRIVPSAGFTPVGGLRKVGLEGKPTGMYMMYRDEVPRIFVSMMSPDPVGVGRHEGIHHLRQYGFFKPEEWAELSRAVRDLDWQKRFNIDKRYPHLDQAAKLEEAIADGFRYWDKSRDNVPEKLHPIFQRIKDFLDTLRQRFKEILGKEPNWEELFGKVDRGEVGRREDTVPLHPEAFKESIEGDRPDLGGDQAKSLRDRIAELSGGLAVDKSHGIDVKADPRQAELKTTRAELRSITNQAVGQSKKLYDRYMEALRKRHEADLEAAQARALEQQRRTQTKEWKANRTEMRDQVREELEDRPDITVDQLMSAEKLKFHPDFLSDEQKAMLPKEFIQKKNGVNPDDAAGFFGYHSGDAMVERLGLITQDRIAAGMNSREWLNHLIDTETDRRMQEKYGDLDARILDEAMDQATSEASLNFLHEETVLLGWLAGEKMPLSRAELNAELRKIFDKTTLGSISREDYLRAAGKAGRTIEEALLSDDPALAFREGQRKNHALILAKMAGDYEKARKSFDRTAKTFSKREVPSVSQEWTNWIHDILQRTGNRVNRSVQDLQENIARQSEQTLTAFIEAKEAETFGLRETPVADFLLSADFRKGMDELTAEQFYGLKQSLDVLVKQGRDEKKIIVAGEAADRAEVLAEMRTKLGTFPAKALPDEAPRMTAALKLPRAFMAGLTNIETLLNRWDRADPRGIFNRYIAQPLAKAANYKSSLEREYARVYGDLGPIKDGDKFVEAPFADPLTRSEAYPEGRAWPGFTRKHVLAMLQNAGNKSNWKVLARGFSADPDALMQWLHRNTTKEDWDRAQKMGDSVFHSLVDKADTVYENLTGATVEKIPLEPIETPFGTYPGWYHPLMADPIRKEVWVKNEDTGIWQRNATGKRGSVYDDGDYFHASTANGYTKRRTGAIYPLDLNFDVVPSRIKQMIHDIAFRQTIIETEKIFGNKSFQAEVTKHYGFTYTDLLVPYLRSMAGAESIPSKGGALASRVSEYLRQNAISTYIGFNPYTALKHGPTAWVMSMREVGGADFLSAVKSLYGQSPDLGLSNSQFAMKHSEELQRRERHWQDTIAGEHKEIEGASTLREKVIEKGSWLVAQSDMLSAKPTWVAAYNKYIGDGLSHGESIDLADRSVRRAHGSTAQTNQPSLVRGGGPLHGWLTSVYGFFGTAMQRRIEIAHQLNDTYQLGKEGEIKAAASNIPKIAGDIFTYVIWPTIVEEWVTGLSTEDKRGWGAHLISGATMGLASSVLYLRDLVHAFTTGHDPGVGLISSPLHDLANVVRDARRGKEAFNRQHAGKTVGDVLTVFGEASGMAPKTIANAARFGIDLVNKQQHPRSGPEWLRGVTRGTAKRREEK